MLANTVAAIPDAATYHLALVRPPDNRLVVHDVLGVARSGQHLAIGDFKRVQYAHYRVLPCTRALLFLQQLAMDVGADERAEVRGMQLDRLLEFFEEEHDEALRDGLSREVE
jgi:hypothetical protein